MSYGETKVYFDGSHYIAIPHTVRPTKRRSKPIEEEITIIQESEINEGSLQESTQEPSISLENLVDDKYIEETKNNEIKKKKTTQIVSTLTKKELFEELYTKYIDLKRNERKNKIIYEMLPYFKDKESCEVFVFNNFERKQRNEICRRVRMCRKANLANFNYFCTFTYDNSLHTENTFKNKLRTCLRNLCFRKKWKYMGVWEGAPETKRLHFHGLFNIPDNNMPGELIECEDYNFSAHKRIKTYQNTYFNARFGRLDFKEINTKSDLMNEVRYICKYIEKTGEKIVYSKGLPQYFISDIMDEDIVCTIGQEDRKLLLFDDFKCWDEGCLIGEVSSEVIAQMRKTN